jgi:cytochrome c-type biogenesis protein CcmH
LSPSTPHTEPTEVQARPGSRLIAVSALFVLVVACAGYLWTGTPAAMSGRAPPPASAAEAEDAAKVAQFTEMVDKLRDRMDKEPAVEGLMMLGRSYLMLDRPAEAVGAYERARLMEPNNAGLLADMADALAVKNGQTLTGDPMRLIEHALRLEPNNLKALMMAGSEAYERRAIPEAIAYWQRMVKAGPAEHPLVQQATQAVQQLQQQATSASATASATPSTPSPASASISGTVDLSAELKSGAAPEDAVFIFARPAEGSRMPLAILRRQVKDLPLSFTLDDSLAMSPQARLSSAQRVVVGARVSKSGNAMPQAGDLEVLSEPMALGAKNVKLEISKTVR